MTNYNKRLDEIVSNAYSGEISWVHDQLDGTSVLVEASRRVDKDILNTKQAITSLIKELVEEAKPSKKHVGDEVAENRSYTGERLFNATIDEYHTNLLKALEEK